MRVTSACSAFLCYRRRQVVEVEASQRVQREARALQSALTFRDHQLSVAQKNHTTAMNDLNAERGKRKRDRQQMERERSEAAARSAAALTAAEAAAVERIAAAEKAAARATEILRQHQSEETLRRGNDEEADADGGPDEEGMRTRSDGRAFPTLADVILSEDTGSLLALLDVSGRVHHARGTVSLGEYGVVLDYANRNTDNFWLRTPSAENRWRGSLSGRDLPVVESGVAPSFMSPEASRARSGAGLGLGLGPGSMSGALKDGGQRMESDSRSGRRFPCGTSGREHKSDVGGFRVVFTPVSSRTQRNATSGLGSWSEARSYSAAGAARTRRSSAGGGPPSVGVFSDGKHAATPSPLGRWASGRHGVDYGGRHGVGVGSSDPWGGIEDERIASVRHLPSRLFACVVELVEGRGCAGDLLDVLAGYLELVAGETVRFCDPRRGFKTWSHSLS